MVRFLREDCWWGGYLMWGGLKEEDNETFNRTLTELNWFVSSYMQRRSGWMHRFKSGFTKICQDAPLGRAGRNGSP